MIHKFIVEINTDEAATEELQEAIYNAVKVLDLANGDRFYVDFTKVEVAT